MKLWEGMLTGRLNEAADRFNASIGVDRRMVFEDIEGSVVHTIMLGDRNILQSEDVSAIIRGLAEIAEEIRSGKMAIDESYEDIHTFIEAKLTERIGQAGKMVHTGRSRNDQVAVDFRMNLRKEAKIIRGLIDGWIKALCLVAEEHLETIMPGVTHLQAAQPVTLAHHLMAYAQMALRDRERLEDAVRRMNESPLGACALAGTSYPIDRVKTAELLGFSQPMQNAMDAVSDRDFLLEILSALSILMVHVSRLAEELILWSSAPYGYIALSDAFSTGSSIMPQKRNPDMAELMRGKAGKLIGLQAQAFSLIKGLPLAYAKDLQEDKACAFEAVDTVKDSLTILAPMLLSMTVNRKRMREAADLGYLNATDLADYLVGKGGAFRDAHHIAAGMVKKCMSRGISLGDLPLEDYREEDARFGPDLYEAIDLEACVKRRKSLGGPAPEEVARQIAYTKNKLEEKK